MKNIFTMASKTPSFLAALFSIAVLTIENIQLLVYHDNLNGISFKEEFNDNITAGWILIMVLLCIARGKEIVDFTFSIVCFLFLDKIWTALFGESLYAPSENWQDKYRYKSESDLEQEAINQSGEAKQQYIGYLKKERRVQEQMNNLILTLLLLIFANWCLADLYDVDTFCHTEQPSMRFVASLIVFSLLFFYTVATWNKHKNRTTTYLKEKYTKG